MGQAGVDLPDPLGTRPPSARHGTVSGGASPTGSASAPLPDDAAADDLLSQLAGEEIDRLLAAADLESEPVAGHPAAPPRVSPPPRAPSPASAAPAPRLRQRTKDPSAAARPPKGKGSQPEGGPRQGQAPLTPGAHNAITPGSEESDPVVQAEFDDAFEQLAGGDAGAGAAPSGYAERVAPTAPQGDPIDVGAGAPGAEAILPAPPADPRGEPLGDLLEQLSAVRAEVEAEVRAEAEADARSARTATRSAAQGEDLSHPPALLAEDEDEPLNLVVPNNGLPAALMNDEALDARLEPDDFELPTSADERAGLEVRETDPGPASREPATVSRESAPVRPAVPVPLDEDAFLAEEPPPADAKTPLPVRVLEWMNKPLAGLPEAVRQAVGKVAILTLINAILVLVYVLLVRR